MSLDKLFLVGKLEFPSDLEMIVTISKEFNVSLDQLILGDKNGEEVDRRWK